MSLFGTMPEFSDAFASEERRKFSAPPEEACDPAEATDPDADLFPYDEGYHAFVNGEARETNPYQTPDFRDSWNLGWYHAETTARTLFQPRNNAAESGHGGSTSTGAGNNLQH